MKRIIRIILITITIGMLLVTSLSCTSKSNSTSAAETQPTSVKRGDLTVDITASGNLALSRKQDLAFEIAGYVLEVSVKEGDPVKEGQVVAKVDTKAWETQVTTLERQLTTAQRSLTATKRSVITAERKVPTAERKVTTTERDFAEAKRQATTQVAAKEQARLQAEINLKNAEITLEKAQDTYKGPEMEIAQANVDKAKAYLEYALLQRAEAGNAIVWDRIVNRAQADLDAAEKILNAMLTGADPDDIWIKKKQLEIARTNLKDAQEAIPKAIEDGNIAIENARIAMEDAKVALEDAKVALEDAKVAEGDAQEKVEDAQKTLDDVKSVSPLVKVPFAGFVTKVNVAGGAEVYKGTVALQIADPAKFEAEILVTQRDFFQVKVGGDAVVQVDAVSISLPAKVTFIAPTATIQQGVVNYKVKVELQSLQPVSRSQSGQTQRPQSGQTQRPQSAPSGQVPSAPTQAVQLSEGLSVTVSILLAQKNNVVLVPNQAITRQGSESVVKVMKDGVAEQRSIKTGLSNWQYTEVTDGLAEGEQVVVPKAISTTTTTSPQRPPGGIMIPGIGGPR